ncbi:MAG: DEAD/DEAH box helicase [Erysipelotrichia bacterium]|nr:DEAD/DEAH box helicase [Erysipelotrichia bacterium]
MNKKLTYWTDEYGFLETIKDQSKYGIFLDMGVGKTSLLLALVDYNFFHEFKKVLVITPKQVSLATWQNEIKKWANFSYLSHVLNVIQGDESKRVEILQNTGEYAFHIISSSMVEWLAGKRVKKGKKTIRIKNEYTPQYDAIIVDECSQFKDTTTYRFKALKLLVKDRLYLMSGTPFSNITRPEKENYVTHGDELYYIMYLLDLYKGSLTQFRNDFCYTVPWEQYKYRMNASVYDELLETIHKKSITKKLSLEISMNHHKIYCPVDKERMRTMKQEFYVETNGYENITAANQAIMINKSLQIANGFIYDEFHNVTRFNTYKYGLLETLLSFIEGNAIIFYNFKEDKDNLLKHLEGAVEYKGIETQEAWNRGEIKYLILSPVSEKYGLNLQDGGNTIIWFGLTWSGESYEQANARLYRRGQKHDVEVYYLMAEHSFDDYVYDTLVSKVTEIDNFRTYLKED